MKYRFQERVPFSHRAFHEVDKRRAGRKSPGYGEYRAGARVSGESCPVLAKSLMPLGFLCADSSGAEGRMREGGRKVKGKGGSSRSSDTR